MENKKIEECSKDLKKKEEKKVQYYDVDSAFLHKACLLPGGKTEATLTSVKTPGVKLFWDLQGTGLLVEFKGKFGFIPAANVAILYFSKSCSMHGDEKFLM